MYQIEFPDITGSRDVEEFQVFIIRIAALILIANGHHRTLVAKYRKCRDSQDAPLRRTCL